MKWIEKALIVINVRFVVAFSDDHALLDSLAPILCNQVLVYSECASDYGMDL